MGEHRFHREYASKVGPTYPTTEEKIVLVDSIEEPKSGILGKWTRNYDQSKALSKAIKERHVGQGRGQG